MTETVLVTGGAGYIGSHVVLALLDAGHRVVVIDNLSTGFRWAVPDGVPFIHGDICDSALLGRTISGFEVGAIMHFAGSIIVPESVAQPLKYYANNTVNSRSLIEAAVRGGVAHFIFSSTAAVYGRNDMSLFAEDLPLCPVNPYGRSKLMTEMMLADVAEVSSLNYAVLRYFNVAGADTLGRTGQSTEGATHLIKVALEAALGRRNAVTIFGRDYNTPDGTGLRDYIHVSDLAVAHVATLAHLLNHRTEPLILNCGYARGLSVLQVLDAVERVTGKSLKRIDAPRRIGDSPMLVADTTRIHSILDWKPRFMDIDTIVSDALAWEVALARR
jgi:UDP-glucose 4-epimerase